ncbi:Mor transcription activator family protein [mine drainage metagenome]|uniref:Mor transcription activator family protein n=1 Tax=mine drainage metagenome TaxID=410659 RepID=A0A1J5T9J9_9ZZZZ
MNQDAKPYRTLYPRVFLEIAEAVGQEAALIICERYGGTRLYVPKKITSDHSLVELVGMEDALKLSSIFGGLLHFDIPQCNDIKRVQRDERIRADRVSGMSIRLIAQKYRLSERRIRNITNHK